MSSSKSKSGSSNLKTRKVGVNSSNSSGSNVRNAGKIFSDKAVSFLVSNAGVLSAKSIAGRLGRTTKAIRRKAEKLGISLSL